MKRLHFRKFERDSGFRAESASYDGVFVNMFQQTRSVYFSP